MSNVIIADGSPIRQIILNRPEKRNALNDGLISALKNALHDADADQTVRAIVIGGAGKDFCSGADLSAIQKIATASYEENVEDARQLADLFGLIRKVRQPVIAAVHGRALAGGCGLATACDLVIATRSARFGYPEVKIGFVPAMVAAILRRNLGEKKSFELLTQGFEFSAQEAIVIGLVNDIFDDEAFEVTSLEYAAIYTKVSASAVQMTKQLLYDVDGDRYADAVGKGVETNARARMTEDCKKGIAGFLEAQMIDEGLNVAEFKPFEKEIVAALAGKLFSEEDLAKIFAEGEYSFEDNHEVGYFINVRHPLIPETRIVLSEPVIWTYLGETCMGFVIFIDHHELAIDACAWGETNVPPDFRQRVAGIKVGKIEGGKFVERGS